MKKLILITFAALFLFVGNVQAQTDDELDLMERAKMVAEIRKLRAENAAKDTIISEKDKTIATLTKLDTVQESRIGDLKEALKYRTEAGNIDLKVEGLYKERIVDYKAENQRLRDENASLRKSRDRRSLIFGVIGAALGKFVF